MTIISSDYCPSSSPGSMTIPWAFHGSQAPLYVSSTSISIASLMERSWDDSYDIINSGTTTVSTASNILVSPNLSGTVTAASGQAVVTGTGTTFTTDFMVGDPFSFNGGSEIILISSITSATSLTLISNVSTTHTAVTYARGGKANKGIYCLYAIANSSTGATECVLSSRSQATGDTFPTADLPSGYNKYRQLPFAVVLDATGVIIPFTVLDWPTNPTVLYQYALSSNQGSNLQLYGGNMSTTMTNLSLATYIPKISGAALVNVWDNFSTTNNTPYYVTDPTIGTKGQQLLQMQYCAMTYLKIFFSPSTRTVQHSVASFRG